MKGYGTLYIIAAPSGAGKTSLVNSLVEQVDNLCLSISYTTRPKRPNDQQGVDYFFVSQAVFTQMIADRSFLEHANVFGEYYGTSHHWVMEKLRSGSDVILEIDWQGAQQIRQKFPDCVSVFIVPPSYEVLRQRLSGRRQDDEKTIERRMHDAWGEMSHYHEFDYLLINDNFDVALADLSAIVHSQCLCFSYSIAYTTHFLK